MPKNKAQVTIFIIIGILLVASVGIFFFLRGGISLGQNLPPEAQGVYNFVQECFDEAGKEITFYIGQGGGYFISPEKSTELGIVYYKEYGQNYMPTKEFIEEEISLFVSAQTLVCIDEFKDFPALKIDAEEIDAKTTIKEEEVVIELNYPIRIMKDESATIIEEFETTIPVRLGIIYESIAKMISEETEDSMCLNCYFDESVINEFYIEIIEDDETKIFIVKDEQSVIGNESFEWVFANKYKFVEEDFE